MEGINENAKVIVKVSDYATDKDGNNIRITFKVYDEPVIKTHGGELEMYSSLDFEYTEPKDPKEPFFGPTTYFPIKLPKGEIEASMQYAKTNVDLYKYKEQNTKPNN